MIVHCGAVGVLTKHISDEDGPTVGWEFNLGDGRHVWIGELSRRSFAELDEDHRNALNNDFGWFIVLYGSDSHRVLGKAVDEYAAKELAEMIGRAMMQSGPGTLARRFL